MEMIRELVQGRHHHRTVCRSKPMEQAAQQTVAGLVFDAAEIRAGQLSSIRWTGTIENIFRFIRAF